MKGYLNGVRVDGTINLKSFAGKILSIIPAYASCLSLGPEGPMVHIGAMVGGKKKNTFTIIFQISFFVPQFHNPFAISIVNLAQACLKLVLCCSGYTAALYRPQS